MDDLSETLSALLNDPNLIEEAQKLLGGASESSAGVDWLRLAGAMTEESDGQRLLRALAPYLRPSRQKKAEEAQKLLAVCRLLPLLNKEGKPCDD